MDIRKVVAVTSAFVLSATSAVAECGMSRGWEQRDDHNGEIAIIWKDLDGDAKSRSIFYQAKAAINTDGAPKSYHPKDPKGSEGLALNTIPNAMEPRPYNREKNAPIPCGKGECYSQWITAFEIAEKDEFSVDSEWFVQFSSIIPSRINDEGIPIPCVQATGETEGFYVSATDARWDKKADKCDQSNYVDAGLFHGNVLPGGAVWGRPESQTDKFDLVVMAIDGSERPVFGINFDKGPRNEIGEVSTLAAAALKRVDLRTFDTYQEVKTLALDQVNYLIFPEVDVQRFFGGRFTQDDVDRLGAQVFEDWGGMVRLRECATLDQYK